MWKIITIILALAITFSYCHRALINNKCSLSDPNINECFTKNGNIAVQELTKGNLNGYDFGNAVIRINDLIFNLEDIKGFQKGYILNNSHLYFDKNKSLKLANLTITSSGTYLELKYNASGFIYNFEVLERGDGRINFGNVLIDMTVDFQRENVNGVPYLKAKAVTGFGKHDKFEFVSSNARGEGLPLNPQRFEQLETPVAKVALNAVLDYATDVFNHMLKNIPEADLFLP